MNLDTLKELEKKCEDKSLSNLDFFAYLYGLLAKEGPFGWRAQTFDYEVIDHCIYVTSRGLDGGFRSPNGEWEGSCEKWDDLKDPDGWYAKQGPDCDIRENMANTLHALILDFDKDEWSNKLTICRNIHLFTQKAYNKANRC